MIDLYYAPTPNGWKITIMLEECSLPYRIIPVNLGKGDQFKPEFLAISPNNRMPVIVDDDGPQGEKISVFESGAILLYLGEKTPAAAPLVSHKACFFNSVVFCFAKTKQQKKKLRQHRWTRTELLFIISNYTYEFHFIYFMHFILYSLNL